MRQLMRSCEVYKEVTKLLESSKDNLSEIDEKAMEYTDKI